MVMREKDYTDDNNPVLIGKVEDLLRVGVVGRAVRVCPHPFDQIVVPEGAVCSPTSLITNQITNKYSRAMCY